MTRDTRSQYRDQGGFTLVELLIVVLILGVVGTATFQVIRSTSKAEQFTGELRTVMDQGRVSLARMRQELRAARIIHEADSDESAVFFWRDQNQDSISEPDEQICYRTEQISGTRWELLRYVNPSGSCTGSGSLSGGQVIARTLRSVTPSDPPDVFTYSPLLDATDDIVPKAIGIELVLDVDTDGSGPDELPVAATVRLRNVA